MNGKKTGEKKEWRQEEGPAEGIERIDLATKAAVGGPEGRAQRAGMGETRPCC